MLEDLESEVQGQELGHQRCPSREGGVQGGAPRAPRDGKSSLGGGAEDPEGTRK